MRGPRAAPAASRRRGTDSRTTRPSRPRAAPSTRFPGRSPCAMPSKTARGEPANFAGTGTRGRRVAFTEGRTCETQPARGTSGTSRAKRPVRWIGSRTNGSRTRDAREGRDAHGPVEDAVAPGPRRPAQKRRRLLPRRRLRLDRLRRAAAHRPRPRGPHPVRLRVVLPGHAGAADRRGRAAAAPGEPARSVRGGGHRADRGVGAARPVHRGALPGHPGRGPGGGRLRFLRPAHRPVPQPRRRALAARRHHAVRPARTHPGAEQAAQAAAGLAPRDGAAPGRRPVLLRRLRGGRPHQRRPHPGGRPHRRLRQGHGRRLARPAAVRRLRRAAGLPAPARLPPRRQRLSAAPGLGGGLRHLHPPRPGPRLRGLRAVLRGPPAGAPAQRGHRPLGGEVGRGTAAGGLRRRPVRLREGLAAPRRRADAVHRRPGGDLRPGHRRGHRPAHRRGRPLCPRRLPRRGLAPHRGRRQGRQRRPRPAPDLPRGLGPRPLTHWAHDRDTARGTRTPHPRRGRGHGPDRARGTDRQGGTALRRAPRRRGGRRARPRGRRGADRGGLAARRRGGRRAEPRLAGRGRPRPAHQGHRGRRHQAAGGGAGGVRPAHPRHPGRPAGEGGGPGAQRRRQAAGRTGRTDPETTDREVRAPARAPRSASELNRPRIGTKSGKTGQKAAFSGACRPRSRASRAASCLNAHSIFGSIANRKTRRTGAVHSRVTATPAIRVTRISPSGRCSQAWSNQPR
ncbi:putative Lead, cadmium, zinc and mercury transporting ATPase Copper-translocating P-type ATPase [Streptomyces misionensis JCM 4497]